MQLIKQSTWILSLGVALGCEACGADAPAQPASRAAADNLQLHATDSQLSARDDSDGDSGNQSRRQRRRWRRRSALDGAAGSQGGAAGSGMIVAPVPTDPADAAGAPSGAAGSTAAGAAALPPPPQAGAAAPVPGAAGSPAPQAGSAVPAPSGSRIAWAPGLSWQYQLTGALDTAVAASVFDIDLYETSIAEISALHAASRKVICYFDTAYEPNRPDSSALEPFRGSPIDGWPGQFWVDQRAPAVREVMIARIALAASKGCDAVEADDIDARSNDPGFPLTADDTRSFVSALADAAHGRNLAFGLKNALDDVAALVSHADFAINEECFKYDECDQLAPFTAANKAVFQVEYADGSFDDLAASVCPQANALGFDTILKHLDLDAPRRACR